VRTDGNLVIESYPDPDPENTQKEIDDRASDPSRKEEQHSRQSALKSVPSPSGKTKRYGKRSAMSETSAR
jgi:hypothetical protein